MGQDTLGILVIRVKIHYSMTLVVIPYMSVVQVQAGFSGSECV
jgi:hypothetical protein